MKLALALAKRGTGRVSPNPLVGAVVVKDGQVVGQGHHDFFGGPHAEVVALEGAKEKASGATLYLNLEPCHHYGKTPPCTARIIESRISTVVIGLADPNPLVGGKGISFLRRAGIKLEVGPLEKQCRVLNEAFIKYITTRLPFTTLKLAATLDGKIATKTGQSKWITSPRARQWAHELRGAVDAIMVGVGTVLADDPLLTYRGKKVKRKRELLRIVADSGLRVPPSAQVLKLQAGARTLLATGQRIPREKADMLKSMGVEVIKLETHAGVVSLKSLMAELGRRQISSLLMEGGSTLAASAVREGVVDKVVIFYSPKILGGANGISLLAGSGPERLDSAQALSGVKIKKLGDEFVVQGYLKGH